MWNYLPDNILHYLHPDLNRNARGQLILNQSWLPISPCRQSMFLASTQAYFYSMVQWSSVIVSGNLFLVLHIQDVIASADYLFRLIYTDTSLYRP